MSLGERARQFLLGRRIPPPPHLPEGAVPDGVVLREGRLIPRIGGLLGGMRGPAAAVTLRRTIVMYPGVRLSPGLLAHELAHVRQWQEDRLFPVRYTLESLRRGYRNNLYEKQAREASASLFVHTPGQGEHDDQPIRGDHRAPHHRGGETVS